MRQITRKVLPWALISAFFLFGIYFQFVSDLLVSTKHNDIYRTFMEQFGNHMAVQNTADKKQFAYYVLAEQCLPSELISIHALGNATSLDVYVNSYRTPCTNNLHPHITYIYDNKTTWTTGRNMLHFYVRGSGKRYAFHIFLDDDVLLLYTEHMEEYSKKANIQRGNSVFVSKYLQEPEGFVKAINETRHGMSAWRAFEQDLLHRSPAFSTINYVRSDGFETYLAQQYHWKKMCSAGQVMPWVTTTYFIDTIVIAYHEQALPLLLPYSPMYDSTNWWVSAIIQLFRARAILFRQCVCNYRITVINRSHRKYPHNNIPGDILKKYIEKEAPEMQNQIDQREMDYNLFKSWTKYEEVFFADRSICLHPLKFPVTNYYRVKESASHSVEFKSR